MSEWLRKLFVFTVLIVVLIICGGFIIGIAKVMQSWIERPSEYPVCFEHQPGRMFYATRKQMNGDGQYIFVTTASGREKAFLRRNAKDCTKWD